MPPFIPFVGTPVIIQSARHTIVQQHIAELLGRELMRPAKSRIVAMHAARIRRLIVRNAISLPGIPGIDILIVIKPQGPVLAIRIPAAAIILVQRPAAASGPGPRLYDGPIICMAGIQMCKPCLELLVLPDMLIGYLLLQLIGRINLLLQLRFL